MQATQLSQTSWQASLTLRVERRAQRTEMTERRHFGPLRVQSPFYPEGEVCHIYILHPPGGVVGGDGLEIVVDVAQGAHTLITTPGAGKYYRSNGQYAEQHQCIKVAPGATLEWMPQGNILFSDSLVNMKTRIDLEGDGRFIGWEMLCLGRPAGGDFYDAGRCRQTFELWRDGQPLVIERALFEAGADYLDKPWGMQGRRVSATFVATGADAHTLEAARQAVSNRFNFTGCKDVLSCTLLEDVLICRFLGDQLHSAHNVFTEIWRQVRPLLLDMPACPPRIWNT